MASCLSEHFISWRSRLIVYGLSVSKDHQHCCDAAADEEKPILWHVEQNGCTAADQRPDRRNEQEARAVQGASSNRSSPNVKIVTGHGVTPNMGNSGYRWPMATPISG